MKILSWNIACLPNIINIYSNPKKRFTKIVDMIMKTNVDIVCLQEVFDYDIQKKIKENLKNHYNIYHSPNDIFFKDTFISRNGLLIASKYDIKEKYICNYRNSRTVEKLINKGIITIEIDKNILIHNTHMHSDTYLWPKKYSKKCRMSQREDMLEYFNLDCFENKKHVLCGDLNDTHKSIDKFINEIEDIDFSNNQKYFNTFPKYNTQFDYILVDKNISNNVSYKIIDCFTDKLSDHNLLIANIE